MLANVPSLPEVAAGAGFVLSAAVWGRMTCLNVRARWNEPTDASGDLPYSFDPRITVRAWIGGACGLVAFLCVLFLLGKLR